MVFNDPYFPALTEAISKGAAEKDLILALFVSYTEAQGRNSLNGILAAGLLDGLIITADYRGAAFIPQLLAAGIPFVFTGRPSEADGINYVDVDNVRGGYLATAHLIHLGYRRIAAIASDQNAAGDDRLTGYQQALTEYERPVDEQLVAYGDYSMESALHRHENADSARAGTPFLYLQTRWRLGLCAPCVKRDSAYRKTSLSSATMICRPRRRPIRR